MGTVTEKGIKMDRETIERLIEQVTRQIAGTVQEEQAISPSAAAAPQAAPSAADLARMIDHTLLKPEATREQIAQLCREAREYHFASVCVNPVNVEACSQLLAGSDVLVCTVVGFPLGATFTAAKVLEARRAIQAGAAEADMVLNVGALKSQDYAAAAQDVAAVARACHTDGAILKVIIEAALLSDEEKVIACQIAKIAGADFVKTSTGFGPGGATPEAVALMRRVVGPALGVKAAGGIHTHAEALQMIAAGANRIGASSGVEIVQEARDNTALSGEES